MENIHVCLTVFAVEKIWIWEVFNSAAGMACFVHQNELEL